MTLQSVFQHKNYAFSFPKGQNGILYKLPVKKLSGSKKIYSKFNLSPANAHVILDSSKTCPRTFMNNNAIVSNFNNYKQIKHTGKTFLRACVNGTTTQGF